LVGVTGHGRRHLDSVHRLGLPLAGVCDVRELPPDVAREVGAAPVYRDLGRMLTECRPDITVIATPIHTHADVAETALRAGSAVLLEKPPVTSLIDLDRLLTVQRQAGRPVDVGFQAMGSGAVHKLRGMVAEGGLGDITGIGASGAWQRTTSYYARAEWAGRRTLHGVPVVDGALSNPFAHALMAALWLTGTAAEAVPSIELELFHANDIDSDDTSCVRAHLLGAPPVVVAGTLCAKVNTPATIVVHGSLARADLRYEQDELVIRYADGRTVSERFARTDQLANLAAGGDPICPLATTRAFTSVVEAIRDAPDPAPIARRHWDEVVTPAGARRVVSGVDEAVRRAAEELKLFSEQGIEWKGRP
jgi:predicted dehydrogenase